MRCVAIASGGMDSVTMIYKLLDKGYEPAVLSFYYGQRHAVELDKIESICAHLELPWQKVDLTDVAKLMKGSALTDSENVDVPEGHYAEETMKATVVPSRNTIMLSIASAYAVSIGADKIFFGAHAGDHAQYPDCRQEYLDKLNAALSIANFSPVKAYAPYLLKDKGDIAIEGLKLGVPYEDTWTCYVGAERPCLKCGACVERCEAFQKAGVPDPLLTSKEWEQSLTNYKEFKKAYEATK